MSLTESHIKSIVANVSLGYGMKIKVTEEAVSDSESGWFLQVYAEDDPCHDTGKPITWGGRKWFIAKEATESEVVLTAWKAFFSALEHEAREDFKYKNVRVLDPHVNIRHLWNLMIEGRLGQENRVA